MIHGAMFPELRDAGIPTDMAEGFMWLLQQREFGMTHWLGINWVDHPMVIQRLVVGEVNELYSVLKVNKFGVPDVISDHQKHELRLEAVDCFILTLTKFMKYHAQCPTIVTPAIMASILVSQWERAVATGQQEVTGREQVLCAIDAFAESALSSCGDRPLEGRVEPLMQQQFRLFIALGITWDQVVTTFAAKQVLNEFRTNRSYNAGGYRKNWWFSPGAGPKYPVPDSVVADTLIQQIDVRAFGFMKRLYNQLIDVYDQE